MTSDIESYDASVPSAGWTIDTTEGPVDMVAVMGRLNHVKGLRLTKAERAVVKAVEQRYRELRPIAGTRKPRQAEAYRRLAHALLDAA